MIPNADKAWDFCALDWDALWKDAHRVHTSNVDVHTPKANVQYTTLDRKPLKSVRNRHQTNTILNTSHEPKSTTVLELKYRSYDMFTIIQEFTEKYRGFRGSLFSIHPLSGCERLRCPVMSKATSGTSLSGIAECSETGEGRHSPVSTRPAPPISRLNCVEDHSLVQFMAEAGPAQLDHASEPQPPRDSRGDDHGDTSSERDRPRSGHRLSDAGWQTHG